MINAIVPLIGESNFLDILIASPLNGADMHLFDNNYNVVPATVLGDLMEASFTGYAAAALSGWTSPSDQGDGSYGSTSDPAVFTPTSGGGSGTIYGGYVTDATGTQLLFAWNFTTGGITIAYGLSLSIPVLFTVLSRY